MAETLIKQAWIAALSMGLLVVLSLFVPDHDSLSQHMSELHDGPAWIALADKITAVVTGISVMLFAAGCSVITGRLRFSWTALSASLLGAAMIASGVFPMGTPLHGLYGLAIFAVLVPATYVAEFPSASSAPWFTSFSLFASTATLVYMWALLVGFDPEAYRGLTQRFATMLTFGWFAVAALTYRRSAPFLT